MTYQRIETSELKTMIEQTLTNSNLRFKTTHAQCRGKGSKHLLKFRLETPIAFATGDIVFPEIVVFNSYNGESALTVQIGLFRVVCSNGLVVGKAIYTDRIVHRQGPKLREFMELLPERIERAVKFINSDLAPKLFELSKTLDFLSAARIVHSLKVSNALKRDVLQAIDPVNRVYRRESERELTLWTLWNIINELQTKRSRSEYANAVKNTDLLDRILAA